MDKERWQASHPLPNKTLCLITLAAASAYNILFSFTRNPIDRDSTLSWIGYDYPIAFLVWGIVTTAAFFLNLLFLYRRNGCRGKIGSAALYAAPFAAFPVVLINDWGWEQPVHLAATMAFVLSNGTALILYFLYHRRRHRRYWITALAAAVILLICVVAHAAIRQNGLTELVPIWMGLFLLFLANFTGIYPPVDPDIPPRRRKKRRKTAVRLALTLGLFGAHDFYLNRWTQAAGHLMMTYASLWLCICRYTGIGHLNHLQGEPAWIFLTAGLSTLAGSVTWAISDALKLWRSPWLEDIWDFSKPHRKAAVK
ncbi:MAG TPA: NINE protein [Candidatus Onthovicinus excrementipullorum]|nr:NINE protein [Candidatus Onthovicinus excrementipullorum]